MRLAQTEARPLEENGIKILKENLSPFSEVDACLALGAGYDATVTTKDEKRSFLSLQAEIKSWQVPV
ncbi:hypothetical protein ACX4ZB_04225 [Aerococcus urinae]